MNGKATISIGGVKTPLFFGYTCLKEFYMLCEQYRSSHYNDEGELTVLGLARLFFSAYENSCYETKKLVTLSFDEFNEYMSNNILEGSEFRDEIVEALDVWAKSQPMQKILNAEKKSEPLNQESL